VGTRPPAPAGPPGREERRGAPAGRRAEAPAGSFKAGASVGAMIGGGIGMANAVVARFGGGDGFLGPLTRAVSPVGVTLVLLVVGLIVGGVISAYLMPALSRGRR